MVGVHVISYGSSSSSLRHPMYVNVPDSQAYTACQYIVSHILVFAVVVFSMMRTMMDP